MSISSDGVVGIDRVGRVGDGVGQAGSDHVAGLLGEHGRRAVERNALDQGCEGRVGGGEHLGDLRGQPVRNLVGRRQVVRGIDGRADGVLRGAGVAAVAALDRLGARGDVDRRALLEGPAVRADGDVRERVEQGGQARGDARAHGLRHVGEDGSGAEEGHASASPA